MDRRVLGLDLSLNSLGWFKDMQGSYKYGNIVPKMPSPITPLSEIERLIYHRDNVRKILMDGGMPYCVVLEGYSFGSKDNNRSFSIGEQGGVIRVLLHEAGYLMGLNLFVATPLQVKKFATSDHMAKKDAIRLHVFKRWDFDDSKAKDDVLDAFVLKEIAHAIMCQRYGWEYPGLTSFQHEVICAIMGLPKPKKEKKGKKQ